LGVFVAEVRPRWSDMDAYGHVNHANTVTLLEEARVEMLFVEAARHGALDMSGGLVVAKLQVSYHAPLFVNGTAFRVEMSVTQLRMAAFTLDYKVHSGPLETDKIAVTAETMLAPFDLAEGRPRRLTEAERDFLAGWRSGSNGV
jgi:acyl-CoA thioester hydrolase